MIVDYFRNLNKVTWKFRTGNKADESIYFPSMDYGRDANETFNQAGLHALTTEYIVTNPLIGKH